MPDAPVPPSDLDAEESVLGAALLSPYALEAAIEAGLQPEDFYRASHGTIFETCVRLYAAAEPIDAITVADKIDVAGKLPDVGGRERLHELAAIVPATANAGHYARIVREHAALRRFILAGEQIQRLGWDRPDELPVLVERAQKLVFDLSLDRGADRMIPLRDSLRETFARIEELHQKGEDVIGLRTGYLWLDRLTAGLQPGNLIILAARPSMGKTALALGIAANVTIRSELPVALFTLEMNHGEVTQRLLSSEALVESQKLRTGSLGVDEWRQVTDAAGRLDPAPLLIDESGMLSALELRAKARYLKMRNPTLALIVIDYLQLMMSGTRAENRNQDVSQTSRTLKILAGELGVPILALSQLSRNVESRHDKRPMLSDLRESGSLEQDADLVWMLYRDDYYNEDDEESPARGIAELNIAKHRNGPTGMVRLSFVERFAKFSDLA